MILENVKNLVGSKFINQFNDWLKWLDDLGYNNYWQILDAKDYGIPQHRERVFVVSIRKDIPINFKFPEKQELKLKLKDMLEENVDEKYFLSDEQVEKCTFSTFSQQKARIPKDQREYASTLMARDYKDPQCVKVK